MVRSPPYVCVEPCVRGVLRRVMRGKPRCTRPCVARWPVDLSSDHLLFYEQEIPRRNDCMPGGQACSREPGGSACAYVSSHRVPVLCKQLGRATVCCSGMYHPSVHIMMHMRCISWTATECQCPVCGSHDCLRSVCRLGLTVACM